MFQMNFTQFPGSSTERLMYVQFTSCIHYVRSYYVLHTRGMQLDNVTEIDVTKCVDQNYLKQTCHDRLGLCHTTFVYQRLEGLSK